VKPLIGVTSSIELAEWGAWRALTVLLPLNYVRAVEQAGGRPLVLSPQDDALEETLDVLDGVVLSGGADVGPEHYGHDLHPATAPDQPVRDRFELDLVTAALARDMPVLAVCRGSQVLNVARGGDLVQHLPELVGSDRHKHSPGAFTDHDVELRRGSQLAAILGERAPVKSHHHQAYGRIGDGLEEAAWAAEDGTVEALEDPRARFAVGVLWHPEEGEDFSLFERLVDEARAYREERLHSPAAEAAVEARSAKVPAEGAGAPASADAQAG
jgi:putative glutamine amidotransferase